MSGSCREVRVIACPSGVHVWSLDVFPSDYSPLQREVLISFLLEILIRMLPTTIIVIRYDLYVHCLLSVN